jgi:hypothetical protein
VSALAGNVGVGQSVRSTIVSNRTDHARGHREQYARVRRQKLAYRVVFALELKLIGSTWSYLACRIGHWSLFGSH